MRRRVCLVAALASASARICAAAAPMPMKAAPPVVVTAAEAAKFVTIKKGDDWDKGGIAVMTQAIAVKETLLRFLNLQPDDEHDFSLEPK